MHKAGAATIAITNEPNIAKHNVNAIGENIFPSTFSRLKMGKNTVIIISMEKIIGLSGKQTEIIKQKLKSYIVNEELRVTSQKHRSQYSNKLDAMEKLQSLLQKALKEKKPRHKTKVPKNVKEKRLKEKSIRSAIKNSRGFKPAADE